MLGTPGSLPADRSFDTLLVSVQRLGLVPRVAYTYDEDLLRPETRTMFVVAPVNAPAGGAPRTSENVRPERGQPDHPGRRPSGSGAVPRRSSAAFDVSITYHADPNNDGAPAPHVHLGGGMDPIKVPAADAFVARKVYRARAIGLHVGCGRLLPRGPGALLRPTVEGRRARYETIFFLLRDALGLGPAERRTYGVIE